MSGRNPLPPDAVVLQNETLRLAFDRQSGALIGVRALQGGWDVLDRPQVGLSFQLLVPTRSMADWHTEGRRNNPVLGVDQTLTSLVAAPDGRSVVFVWDGVVSQHAGPLPIKVTVEVTLDDQQATWTTTIENRSDFAVENVYCPYLGDLRPPPDADSFRTFTFQYSDPVETSLWPTFDNTRGYFGNDLPIQPISWTPHMPFCLLRSDDQGLYVGVGSSEVELVSFVAELTPGYDSAMESHVPEADRIADKPVATRFAAVHVPHVMPGETRRLVPIVLQPFRGSWHAGADIYRRWRRSWMKVARPPQWADEPHAWLQLHINSPEDELRMRFSDLVEVGRQCARHGIKAIQLVGWNDGGQDQGNPSHDPDSRLGTFGELRRAIEETHKLGVRVILFAKFTWADRGTEAYRTKYRDMAIKDPYGDPYVYSGYQYQTTTQFLNINTKRLVPMCFLDDRYMDVCREEFDKLVRLGAAGMLYDESQHHSPALQCFAADHGHRYGAHVYARDREFICQLQKRAPADFLVAGEACYDWEFEAYQLSYFRTWNARHVPLWRYLLPDAQIMTAVCGFNDRNMVNQCLLYRYVMSYEPFNFKGLPDDFPETIEYGKRMDALRSELRDWFWDGEFRDTLGASVTADGRPHHPYTVFTSAKTGRPAVAVANYDLRQSVTVEAALAGGQKLDRWRLVDDDRWQSVSAGIVLPPSSAAVIVG